jgi:hypothetical protein
MGKVIISDTSCLIALDLIDHLEILHPNFYYNTNHVKGSTRVRETVASMDYHSRTNRLEKAV